MIVFRIPLTFEWDRGNQNKSLKKHGISDQEAEQVFFNPNLIIPDPRHSLTELRYGLCGITSSGKTLFIVFTIRNYCIRIISARMANRKEKSIYDKEIKNSA
jgi:uncharacterized protein